MPRGNVWLILIVIASMIGVWYFGFAHDQIQSRAAQVPIVEDTAEVPVAATPAPSPRNENRRSKLQNELENLQAELSKKTQQVETQKKALDRLHQQQNALSGSASLSSQVQTRDLAVQNLLQDLDRYHQAEEDINQSAAMALKNQDSQAALARAEVDANIQNLEQAIHNTQNELKFWQMKPDWEATDVRPQEIQRLQVQLDQQNATLSNLRSQRVGISASVLSNTQTIQSLSEQAKAELRNNSAATQERIYSLRDEMDRLERTQSVSQGQLQGLNLQISKAERDLEDRTTELQRIQEAVQAKQSEIQSQ